MDAAVERTGTYLQRVQKAYVELPLRSLASVRVIPWL